ncbi:unnamed protein product [Spirodela intermedia]|uniref:Uncharacterized protein n=1 Tax=Spirodela intermedia TaxID=51605 RepID=A0A7I8L8L2_SPIIN|nr:unnamed protein product [Spirodela intermedia]
MYKCICCPCCCYCRGRLLFYLSHGTRVYNHYCCRHYWCCCRCECCCC